MIAGGVLAVTVVEEDGEEGRRGAASMGKSKGDEKWCSQADLAQAGSGQRGEQQSLSERIAGGRQERRRGGRGRGVKLGSQGNIERPGRGRHMHAHGGGRGGLQKSSPHQVQILGTDARTFSQAASGVEQIKQEPRPELFRSTVVRSI